MRKRVFSAWMILAAGSVIGAGCMTAEPGGDESDEDEEEVGAARQAVVECPGKNVYGNLYWGELHQHTSYSLDAYSFGNRADPGQALAFAKGSRLAPPQQITLAQGSADMPAGGYTTVTQRRDLDFAAITDHSEFLSVVETCVLDPTSANYGSNYCVTVRSSAVADESAVFAGLGLHMNWPCAGAASCGPEQSAWAREVAFADQANADCDFTALPAYEWTDVPYSAGNGFVTDHRNVLFSTSAVPVQPLDSAHYATPPALWSGLSASCVPPACDAVTIPHNTNQSAGVSLQVWDPTMSGVALQRRYQVSAEIYQHKGNSECFWDPATGNPQDPDCHFEHTDASPVVAANFVRNGLETGIQYASDHPLQGNPLQLGIVGATDNHNSTPGYVSEDTWDGHVGRLDDTAEERLDGGAENSPGGITGAWAPQNTRADIFSSIQNRHTFATSGPRIRVRVYQTSSPTACQDPQFPKQIVDANKGVEMGGSFGQGRLAIGDTMALAIWAFPDTFPQGLPNGSFGTANFDKVQVIKAYINGAGQVVESAPATVANFPATGGCKLWVDPSFDKTKRAVYYVRVLQTPTWRWSHYDCQEPGMLAAHPLKCLPGQEYNRTIQERAWTSPLWYTP